jgi:hypothetical protein
MFSGSKFFIVREYERKCSNAKELDRMAVACSIAGQARLSAQSQRPVSPEAGKEIYEEKKKQQHK